MPGWPHLWAGPVLQVHRTEAEQLSGGGVGARTALHCHRGSAGEAQLVGDVDGVACGLIRKLTGLHRTSWTPSLCDILQEPKGLVACGLWVLG